MHAGVPTSEVGIGWRHAHYASLLEQRPDLNFLEVHSENFFAQGGAGLSVLEQGRALYPVSLHGVGLSLGAAVGVDPWHLDQLGALVERIDPVRVSDHAAFARAAYQGQTIHAADLLPVPFTPEALDVLCNNVDAVQSRIQRQILVENLSAYVRWKPGLGEVVLEEPAFLQQLVQRTGCLLLVDINNIYVNACNAHAGNGPAAEAACRLWLDAIAAQSVGEMHLAGHTQVADAHGTLAIDDHGSRVCDAVWRLYQYACTRFGPVPTLIEWDTEVPALEVLLDEVHTARGRMLAALAGVPG